MLASSERQQTTMLNTTSNAADMMKSGMGLADMFDKSTAAQNEANDQATLAKAFKMYDPTTEQGMHDIVQSTKGHISAEKSIALANQGTKQSSDRLQLKDSVAKYDMNRLKDESVKNQAQYEGANDINTYTDEIRKRPDLTDEKKIEMIKQFQNERIAQEVTSQVITQEEADKLPRGASPEAYNFYRDNAVKSKTHGDALTNELNQRIAATKQREADTASAKEKWLESQGKIYVGTDSVDGKQYNYTRDPYGNQHKLGLAVPKAVGGSRITIGGQRYANNVLSSLQDISSAASNLANIPITSGKLFHIDQATHILSAPEEVLKAVITSDEANDFTTFITAVGIGVAQLKDPSYKPNGTSIAEIQQVYAPAAGSSNHSVLVKMAHLRQDAENGYENAMSSPMMTPDQKKLAASIIERIRKAIPYTVDEVTNVRYSGDVTLRQTGLATTKDVREAKPPAPVTVEHDGKKYQKVGKDWIEQ